jgi:pullulanase
MITLPEGEWGVLANHQFAGTTANEFIREPHYLLEPITLNVLLKK